MGNSSVPCLTLLLQDWQNGNQEAGEKVFSLVFQELKKVASAYLRREQDITLQTTDLVNEAYIRLFNDQHIVFTDRKHFYGIAARAMRQILVEQVRKKSAQKRFSGQAEVTLHDDYNIGNGKPLNLIRLDDALSELESMDREKARLVELRFFAGLSNEEISIALGLSLSKVKREWSVARAWLYNRLTQ